MIAVQLELGKHLEGFVKKQIESGFYASENEVVKEAIANLEKKKSLEMLDIAILEGENSGTYKEFDSVAFLKKLNKQHDY
jgi:antitoxin ParD1/3/4